MDGLALIQKATQAGMTVWVEEGNLKIKGPRRRSALAGSLVRSKEAVMAALREPAVQKNELSNVDADTRPGNAGKYPSSVGAGATKEVAPQVCGPLHIQPKNWVHRNGRAYCPGCERFMGYLRAGQ